MKILLISLFALTGCMTTLSREAVTVRVVRDAQFVKGCKYIQTVDANSSWGGFAATGVGYNSAMNELKNNTAQVGGNTLLIVVLENSMGGTNMTGDAYRCGSQL